MYNEQLWDLGEWNSNYCVFRKTMENIHVKLEASFYASTLLIGVFDQSPAYVKALFFLQIIR